MSRTLFYLGCLTIPALAFRPIGRIAVSDVLFGLSAVAAAASVCRPRTQASGMWQLAAVLATLGGLLATTRAFSAAGNLAITARLVYILVVWPWQARLVVTNRARMEKCLKLFTIGAACSSLVAVLQYQFGIAFGGGRVLHGRALGLAQHVNDQGGVLAIALTLAVGLIVHRQRREYAILTLIAAICGVGLILSGSVSGMLAALIGITLLALRQGVSLKVLTVGAMVLCSGWLAAGNLRIAELNGERVTPLQRLSVATGGGREEQNTVASRIDTYGRAIDRIRRNPLVGSGLDENSGITSNGLPAHNLFLLAWLQGGVLVLAAEIVALMGVVREGFGSSQVKEPLRETLIAGFVSALVFSMTAPTLFNRYFWFPAVCLITISAWKPRGTALETAIGGVSESERQR